MASIDNEQIIIDFETNAASTVADMAKVKGQIDELKKAQKELQDIKKQNGSLTEAEAEQYEQLGLQIKTLGNTYRQLQTEGVGAMTALKDSGEAYSDSIAGMRAQLSDLLKIYDNLSEADRQSSKGLELQSNINDLTSQLKTLEEETGRFQRNVGNYPEVVKAIIPGINDLNGLLSTLGLQMKDLEGGAKKGLNSLASSVGKSFSQIGSIIKSNPIGAILTAIVLVVNKLSDAFKKNDDAMTALQKAFTAFEPIIEGVNFLFDKLAEGVAWLVGGMANLVKAVGGLIPGYEESQKAAEGLVQAQDDLEESEREYTVNSARRNKEIAKLRDKAVENPDVRERMKALKEAQRLEEENLKEELALSKKRMKNRILQAKIDKDTSDETKNEIAKMRADMLKAEQTYYEGHRKLQKEYNKYEREAISGLSKERQELYKNLKAKLNDLEADKERIKQKRLLTYVTLTGDTSSKIYQMIAKKIDSEYSGNGKIAALQKQIDAMLKESENAQKKADKVSKSTKDNGDELKKNLEKLNEELLNDNERVLNQLKKDYDEDVKTLKDALKKKLISENEYYDKLQQRRTKYNDEVLNQLKNDYDDDAKSLKDALDKKLISEDEYYDRLRQRGNQYNDAVVNKLKKDYDDDAKSLKDALDKKLLSENEYYDKLQQREIQYNDAVVKQNEQMANTLAQNRISEGESQINEKYDNGDSLEKQLLDLEYDDYADYQLRKQQLTEETNQKILDNEIAKSQAMIALWQQELSDWEGTEEEKAKLQSRIDGEQDKLTKNLLKKQENTLEAQNKVTEKNEKKKEKIRDLGNKALSQGLSTASALAGDNAEAQKGIQVADAIINTISGAVGAFQGITKDTGGWGIALATATAAMVTAAGMANVKEIIDTKIPGGDGSGSAASTAPSINASSVASLTDSTQAVNTVIGDETIQAMSDQRVYVVESDITSTQKKVEVAENGNNF